MAKQVFAAKRSAVRKMLIQGGLAKAADASDERLITMLGIMAQKDDVLENLDEGPARLFERFTTVLEAADDDTDNIEFAFRDDDEEAEAKPAKKPSATDDDDPKPAKKPSATDDDDGGDDGDDEKPTKKSKPSDDADDDDPKPPKKSEAKDDGEDAPKRGRGRPKLSEDEKAARRVAKASSDDDDPKPAKKTEHEKTATVATVDCAVGCVATGPQIKYAPTRNMAYLSGVVLQSHLEDCASAGEITDAAASAVQQLIGDDADNATATKRMLQFAAHAIRGYLNKSAAKTEIDYLKAHGIRLPKDVASKLLGE